MEVIITANIRELDTSNIHKSLTLQDSKTWNFYLVAGENLSSYIPLHWKYLSYSLLQPTALETHLTLTLPEV